MKKASSRGQVSVAVMVSRDAMHTRRLALLVLALPIAACWTMKPRFDAECLEFAD
jgi:hypothetical protein